jgi:hypothetical protein
MFKSEEIKGLLIGLLVVMIVTWITLPTVKEAKHNKECIAYCKKEIKKGNADIAVYSSFTYVRAMIACYEGCVEGYDEDSD